MGRIKNYFEGLEEMWMGELYKRQEEYCRTKCLNPQDNDWKRLK